MIDQRTNNNRGKSMGVRTRVEDLVTSRRRNINTNKAISMTSVR